VVVPTPNRLRRCSSCSPRSWSVWGAGSPAFASSTSLVHQSTCLKHIGREGILYTHTHTHTRTCAHTHAHAHAYTHTHTHTHSFLLQGTTQPSTNAVEVQRNSHNFCLQGTSTPSGRLRPHHHRLFNPSSCHLGRTKHCAFSTITPRPVASAPRHVHTSRSKSGPGSWTIDATQSKEPSPLCTGMLESIVRSNNKS